MNKVLFSLFLAFFVFAGQVSAYDVPDYQGFVNDFAGVISEGVEVDLETQLSEIAAQENGAEIVVVTVENLDGEYIEAVVQDFFDTWSPGKGKADNGVILFLTVEERELRIQTGYGAEVFLTDSRAGQIIRNVMVPSLKEGDYDGAIIGGVDSVVKASQGIDQAELISGGSTDQTEDEVPGWIGLVPFLLWGGMLGFTYIVSFLGRSKSWWAGGVIGLLIGLIFTGFKYSLIFAGVGLVLDYILSRNYKKWKLEKKSTSWGKTFGGFHSGGGSFGGSSRGSSGFGGGSSGGGGASGSW